MQAVFASALSSSWDSPGTLWGAGQSSMGDKLTFPSSCLYSFWEHHPCMRCKSAHFFCNSKTAAMGEWEQRWGLVDQKNIQTSSSLPSNACGWALEMCSGI